MLLLQINKPLSNQISLYRRRVLFLAEKKLPICFFDDDFTQKYFSFLNSDIEMPCENYEKHLSKRIFQNARQC